MINKQSHQLSAVKKRTARVLATCASFLSGLIVATQQFASDFNYSDALGWNVDGWYAPWAIIDWHLQWGNVYPDQFMVAESSGVVVCSALLLGVVIANQVRANSSQSHDKLHGSARWANRRDLEAAGLLKKSRWFGKQKSGHDYVYVGAWQDKSGKTHYLKHNGAEHVLCFAPTRSGKGVGLVIPTLLSWGRVLSSPI